jgi:hypothetical protein
MAVGRHESPMREVVRAPRWLGKDMMAVQVRAVCEPLVTDEAAALRPASTVPRAICQGVGPAPPLSPGVLVGHQTARSSASLPKASVPRRGPRGVDARPRACAMPGRATVHHTGLRPPPGGTPVAVGCRLASSTDPAVRQGWITPRAGTWPSACTRAAGPLCSQAPARSASNEV